VCGSFARAAYGIPESTWLKLTALANKGRAHLERAEGMCTLWSGAQTAFVSLRELVSMVDALVS
jgi:hypothetical protein